MRRPLPTPPPPPNPATPSHLALRYKTLDLGDYDIIKEPNRQGLSIDVYRVIPRAVVHHAKGLCGGRISSRMSNVGYRGASAEGMEAAPHSPPAPANGRLLPLATTTPPVHSPPTMFGLQTGLQGPAAAMVNVVQDALGSQRKQQSTDSSPKSSSTGSRESAPSHAEPKDLQGAANMLAANIGTLTSRFQAHVEGQASLAADLAALSKQVDGVVTLARKGRPGGPLGLFEA